MFDTSMCVTPSRLYVSHMQIDGAANTASDVERILC